MTSRRKPGDGLNGDGRNEKGEDIGKFMRELKHLIPAIEKNVMPVNREHARQKGLKNTDEFVEAREEALLTQRFRAHEVNKYFDARMLGLFPRLFRLLQRLQKPGWFKLLGFRFTVMDGWMPVDWKLKSIPTTTATIYWGPFIVSGLRFVWEDPNPPKNVKKKRIIEL